ncbi:MAG: hypothetical protein GF408_03120 [Candidatus Omnitrophica bacterium]|nr:hypothetical protein [Candidatus Omnitrophota bacterium]
MRALFLYANRRKRLLLIAFFLAAVYAAFSVEHDWLKEVIEAKVSRFMGGRLEVEIGQVRGGIFGDMSLKEVDIRPSGASSGDVFRIERMDVSYRLWRGVLEKLGFFAEKQQLEYISLYFDRDNPFLRGYLKLESYPGKILAAGHLAPVIFGETGKKAIKGVFLRNETGKYDCDLVWDGKARISGLLDPSSRSLELACTRENGKPGTFKVKGQISDERKVDLYFRSDKVMFYGIEIIGDAWLSYSGEEGHRFTAKAENLLIAKNPLWNLEVEGRFRPERSGIVFEKIGWGENIVLRGQVRTVAPYPVDLELLMKEVDLVKLVDNFGGVKEPLSGKLEADIKFDGPAASAKVKGRFFVGEGKLGELEFRSVSAGLKGQLPFVELEDARVMKEGGNILISGGMDFSRMLEGKVFEKLAFASDNKVAVWDRWQIMKEEQQREVTASRDNVTFTTSFDNDDLQKEPFYRSYDHRELGVNYELEGGNSIKMGFEEDDDFLGMEHKMRF